jgi:hypothetical protein
MLRRVLTLFCFSIQALPNCNRLRLQRIGLLGGTNFVADEWDERRSLQGAVDSLAVEGLCCNDAAAGGLLG